jgi:hypothetical protein
VLLSLKDNPASVLLGAARAVATGGGTTPLSSGAVGAIISLAVLGLGCDPPTIDGLKPSTPDDLAAALSDPGQAAPAAEILAIIALVDGDLNRPRIEQVLQFAQKLDVHDSWLDDLAKSLDPDLGPIIADMGDKNLRSVTDGRVNVVSTFTSRMHPIFPMEGHVLPVIYSWHLGIEFNKLAGSYKGALDPAKFWVAWDRGLQTSGDTFAEEFDLWHHADAQLASIRSAFEVRALDDAHEASSNGTVAGVDYNPIA